MPRVHILGGGPSALAAAHDLVTKSGLDVTIYTAGWRLGGKCASGMGLVNRNEEHGLHLPLGFYENFFDQVRSAYDAVSADLRFSSWDAAFTKRNTVVVEQLVEGKWLEWSISFPEGSGKTLPGDLARDYIDQNPAAPIMDLKRLANRILERAIQYGTSLAVSTVQGIAGVGKELVDAVGNALGPLSADDKMGHLQQAHQNIRAELAGAGAFEALKAHVYFELGVVGAKALLSLDAHGLPLSAVDNLDFLEWLDQHGLNGEPLSDETRTSGPIKMVYELVFAYLNGDPDQPRLAAGVAARGILRLLFGYQGAFAYDVTAGMGECAITPYYLALKKSGRVGFQFFSRLTAVSVANGRVVSFDLARQATQKGPTDYSPLAGDKNTRWPATPLYAQLEEGPALGAGNELANGGFDLESSYSGWKDVAVEHVDVAAGDFVVLAIPAPELTALQVDFGPKQATWVQMLANVTGVGTASAQLWLNVPFANLGWPQNAIPVLDPALVGAFADPFGNLADMSRLIRQEDWQDSTRTGAKNVPAGLVFLCGPFKENAPPPPAGQSAVAYTSAARASANQTLQTWLANEAPLIMPGIGNHVLFVPSEVAGGSVPPLNWQYAEANVGPAHRYITSFPETIVSRIPPDCRNVLGVANLLLAGDWTDNGFNAGCLEAAVTSGRLAARAVMGGQYFIYGQDDAHW